MAALLISVAALAATLVGIDRRADCGDEEEFCCEAVPGSDPTEDIKLCKFANKKGKCE